MEARAHTVVFVVETREVSAQVVDLFPPGKHDPNVRPIGMGKWVRKQVEYSLLFSRGKPSRLEAGVRQLMETGDNVIYAPKREHSRKPDERIDILRARLGRGHQGQHLGQG